jgi:alpha-methylacyl-CoA racemase
MGPLQGLKVVEIVGIGPAPFAAMLLADMGATVVRIDRADRVGGSLEAARFDLLARGRPSVGVDLKQPAGVATVLRLVERSDALIEGFRPGVMERLGLGPEPCLGRNPRLAYGRMTGWGQDGPRAQSAGHDIDYIALSGALHAIGRRGQPPVPPLNLVGDFGGGGMLLAFGLLCAAYRARITGVGQVVDAAMVDGSALLMSMAYGMAALGYHHDQRGVNLLDGGAHFYDTYLTADGKYLALGAIEPQFYARLLEGLGLDANTLPQQLDRASWPAMKERFAAIIASKSRAAWCEIFDGTDACVAPVLSMEEAPTDAHVRARGTFVNIDGIVQPAPAPRFSRDQPSVPGGAVPAGHDTVRVLLEWGFDRDEIEALRRGRAIA